MAIARVILLNPLSLSWMRQQAVLIHVQSFISRMPLLHIMKGRTSFIIAHRLNTIRDADTIMVIDRGGIAEKGDHEALMNGQGVYYHMFYNQFKNLSEFKCPNLL